LANRQWSFYFTLRIFVGTITIDFVLLIYLNLSAKGPIIALDFPKLVPSSINVIFLEELRSILKTITCSGLSSNFNFSNSF